jgi:hypothetical protein
VASSTSTTGVVAPEQAVPLPVATQPEKGVDEALVHWS